ncbi:sunset domain-containing protein [Pseudonocardia bannensis]|uniref:sunset domain-containing protein n=1 Tax=Pseudonocardia bannensis TaxID=630973 RepID=UPI001FE5F99C|nr:hypothetical protein [Pseudonocardia bannensis]
MPAPAPDEEATPAPAADDTAPAPAETATPQTPTGAVSAPAPSGEPAEAPSTGAGPGTAADVQESSYGPGSALPLPDGSAPSPEYTIKGNGNSKLFHAPTSPYFGRTKAEVWFRTAEDARRAGFTEWTRKPRSRRSG